MLLAHPGLGYDGCLLIGARSTTEYRLHGSFFVGITGYVAVGATELARVTEIAYYRSNGATSSMTPGFTTSLYVSTAVDFGIGALVLLGRSFLQRSDSRSSDRGRAAIDMGRVAFAFFAVLVTFAVKAWYFSRSGLDSFGLLHLVYLDLVVMLPILGAVTLLYGVAMSERTATNALSRPVWILAVLASSLAAVGAYASLIEPFRLQLERATIEVPDERAGTQALHVGVIADLQTDRITDYERGAFASLLELKPDIILIAGDLFQGTHEEFERELPALKRLVASLEAPGGVYFVSGNTDHSREELVRVFAGSAVRRLEDEIVSITLKDRRVTVGGVDAFGLGGGARPIFEQLANLPGAGDIRILLSHYPDVVLRLKPQTRVDLVVAGHTHGGQVQLPFFGPPVTLSAVPRSVGAGGYHVLDGRGIYVSRGIGMERGQAPRIRFLCPPGVSLLTLVGKTAAAK